MTKVLITGARGQMGSALCRHFGAQAATQVVAWSHADHDITRPAIAEEVAGLRPHLVINAAAWTHVDSAESNAAAAYAANTLGPKYLAEGCAACGAEMVQISTNEIFAGKPGEFYREYDLAAPGGVYARSKLGGEAAAARALARLYVVRVAWLYGPGGNHFPAKMIAAADRQGALRVVDDEYGNPTYTLDAAAAIAQLVQSGRYGIYHIVNEGFTSRYEYARLALALSGRSQIPLTPIPSSEWPRPAPPPLHAVLVNQTAANLGIRLRPWQEALQEYFAHER
jgi:dTDP-4-dehydrorhamnose reductase